MAIQKGGVTGFMFRSDRVFPPALGFRQFLRLILKLSKSRRIPGRTILQKGEVVLIRQNMEISLSYFPANGNIS